MPHTERCDAVEKSHSLSISTEINMPPKKRKMRDIRTFFKKSDDPSISSVNTVGSSQPGGAPGSQPGGAPGSQPGGAPGSLPGGACGSQPGGAPSSQEQHSHIFTVKFSGRYEYPVNCNQPCTVLEAIKSTECCSKKMKKFSDENIVIQLGKEDHECIVATHFPCSCISPNESLIISCESEKVEESRDRPDKMIYSRDKYSVFYIDREGGLHTKLKRLFRNGAVKQFKYLCVYAEKGVTVEEALRRDGRFIDDLGDFTLSDNNSPNSIIGHRHKVNELDQKKFKIRLPRKKGTAKDKQLENTGPPDEAQQSRSMVVSDVVLQRGTSVRTAVESEESGRTEEIYEILRRQFPDLIKLMESRFPENQFEETLRKEDFKKTQQSFSEVHRVRKLLKLGESVCKVVVENVSEGTGFVLFDNLILTNRHLFKDCVQGGRLMDGINVFFLFNYEEPAPNTDYLCFKHDQCYISVGELDFAILDFNPEGHNSNQTTQTRKMKVPPGLLKAFGPMPPNGEACIIGHPAGEVKKMDPTCIIEMEKRGQAVKDGIPFKNEFIVHTIGDRLKQQGIESILIGGKSADKVVTYNTFMYHGSSGSPVFDAHGRVFGLHTGGYIYRESNKKEECVIAFAQPLLDIFEHFISELKKSGNDELLERVGKEARTNQFLQKILLSQMTDNGAAEPGSDESMDSYCG